MIVTPSTNADVVTALPLLSVCSCDTTRRSDTLPLHSSAPFSFPQGLFGFPGHLSFQLVSTVRNGVYWLHGGSIDFLLIDPFEFFPGYVIDVPDDVVTAIGAEAPGDVLLLSIVTLGSDPGPTANLQGPLALNPRLGLARQFVVTDPEAGIRAPLVLQRAAS